jgi:hypothetical protein
MTPQHEETRITANLPNLDMEIRHRDEGDAGEVVTIRLQATPNLRIAAGALLPAIPFALASTTPVFANPFLANPFTAWMQLTRALWQPWLRALQPPDDHPADE